ncbi:hypothetical protein [Chelativorans sp. Marseille-P2723]|uniref:hypothetical protein n=1 Tax=Chelativorans sp. Marseille-P2723 TaxID=2709133 RepID=UPI0015708E6A|nr:hypothetical protein [Chelativorans sp. Marseille-P2723]
MAMLGDILAEARRSSDEFESWLGECMPDLLARIGKAAERSGESAAEYVRGALADFSQFASEEEWAGLTSRMRDSADPGTACLLTMVRWRLATESAGGGAEHDRRT